MKHVVGRCYLYVDVVDGWRYLYFDVLSMAERQQCLDGGGMEYIIAGWVREMRSERWQHEILHSYCVDEDEDDDGSFNDTPNGSKPITAITPPTKIKHTGNMYGRK